MVPPEQVRRENRKNLRQQEVNEELELPPLLLQVDSTVVKPLAIKNLLHCKVS